MRYKGIEPFTYSAIPFTYSAITLEQKAFNNWMRGKTKVSLKKFIDDWLCTLDGFELADKLIMQRWQRDHLELVFER